MLPAQPPHSRRISPTWKQTESTCVCSGRMWRAKRSGNTMMVSYASEPQINVRMDGPGVPPGGKTIGAAEFTAPRRFVALRSYLKPRGLNNVASSPERLSCQIKARSESRDSTQKYGERRARTRWLYL